jgi:hypothetical protein
LYPDVKITIAYILLIIFRPFFTSPESEKEEDILGATKWTFNTALIGIHPLGV